MKYIKKFQLFNEAVGVPSGIIETARSIYNDFINLNFDDVFDDGFKKVPYWAIGANPVRLDGDYTIGDLKFNKIYLDFNFHVDENKENSELILAGLSIKQESKIKKDSGKIKYINVDSNFNKSNIGITIDFICSKDSIGENVSKYFETNEAYLISKLSHELKHIYDGFKKSTRDIAASTEYDVYNGGSFGDVAPLRTFMYNMYYLHNIENLVRPSEMAGEIEALGITKEQFYKYFTNNEMYKKLDNMRKYTFEKMKEDLKEFIPQMKELLEIEDNIPPNHVDGFIKDFLKFAYMNITHWKLESVSKAVAPNPLALILNLIPKGEVEDARTFFKEYHKKTTRFGKDYEKFFKFEINKMANTANKVIKKIAKLYSIAKENN
jgi:hypothetical protein